MRNQWGRASVRLVGDLGSEHTSPRKEHMARVTVIALVVGVALLAGGCGGGDSEEPTATATAGPSVIATATPFATLPTPTVLDGGGVVELDA